MWTVPEPALAQATARPIPGAIPLRVPLSVDGIPRDEIEVLINLATDEVRVESAVLLAEIGTAITADRRKTLESRRDAQGNLSLQDLRDVGLEAEFDQGSLELALRIPSELRATVELRLRADSPPTVLGAALPPAKFSGFLNYRTAIEATEQDDNQHRLDPIALNLDGAVNVRGWALEGRGGWYQAGDPMWRRSETRLVRDFPDRMLRLNIGDLNYATRGFQSFQPLGGISIAKEPTLQPYRLARPSGEAGFFLSEPATVTFIVNERPLRTMRLSPGPYNARSFPFIGGINDVRIEILGDSGARQVVEFPFVFDGGLLNAGETEFGYAIGLPSFLRDGEVRYDTSRLGVSLYHRYGLTNAAMIEGNFQADSTVALLGGGALVTGRIGTIRTDVGWSLADRTDGRDKNGYTVRTQFERRDGRPSNTTGRVWTTTARYTSPTFASLGSPDNVNDVAWDLAGRYSQRLWGLGWGVGLDYQFGRNDRRDTAGGTVQVQRNLGMSSSIALRLRDSIDTAGEREQGAFLTFSIKPGNGQNVSLSRDTASASTRLDWRFAPEDDANGFGGFAGLERTPDANTANADFQYAGTRGTVGMGVAHVDPRSANVDRESSGSLRFAGGIAFADGAWAVGRPISDSFAILKPHPSLRDYDIGVNPLGDGTYQAQMDNLGPALLPALVPYRAARATVDARQLPIGLNVGPGAFDMAPTYKRGTLVTVGTGATVFLLATLENPDGTPVSLQAGRMVSLDDPNFEPALVFTNRIGRIAVEGLKPGAYYIELFTAADRPVRVVIPDSASGQYDIGPLTLKEKAAIVAATAR